MIKIMFSLMLFFSLTNCLEAVSTNTNDTPNIIKEPDQTDVYAIPFDEDAEDQEEELKNLENPQPTSKK